MNCLTVKFFDKDYTIPADVVTYVDLVVFTDNIRDALMASFKNQIWHNIEVIENENFMVSEINTQITRFIRKLLENDIYDRTANDYLSKNKGYDLFLESKKKVIRQLVSIRKEKLETYRAGVQDAINKKESSVTGLDFGIISSSFVNHMIYAYMDASKQTKQEKEALKVYNQEIEELDKAAAAYDRLENSYIAENVIPAMNTVFTFFAYELLDKYVSDLIRAGKFDKDALKFIDLERSNDLLENINLAGNKRAVIESAFVACPFNMAVYMHAMKQELLDNDTFATATVFKQGAKIISFLKESLGTADYPKFVEPNYYCATLLARYTNKSANDVLHQHTASYANAVIREYGNIIKALNSSNQCRDYLCKLSDDEILSGEGASKRVANSLVYSIASNSTWNILVNQCGHKNLFERLQAIMPVGLSIGSKADCDSCLAKALFDALEVARKDLAQRILDSRSRAEAERKKIEAQKKRKQITTTAILCAIVAVIIVAISLPSIIENAKTSKRESYIEEQIQEVIVPLEKEMENATGVDIIIDYYFSLENDWEDEQWYEWTFGVELPIFEEYRKSNSTNEQSLLKIMDACKTLVEIYDDAYDGLDFEFKDEDTRIVMDFSGGNFGSLTIRDLSTTETFYYEEYGGERYLHSYDTEYVIDADLQYEALIPADDNEDNSSLNSKDYDEYLTWYNVEFASSFLGKELNADGSLSMAPGDYEAMSNDMYLFDIPGRFSHGMSSADTEPVNVDILDWVTTEAVDNFNDILNPLIERYGDDYRVQYYNDATGDAYMWKDVEMYKYVICWQNADGTVDIRWTADTTKSATSNDFSEFEVNGLRCYVPAGWEIYQSADGTVGKGSQIIDGKHKGSWHIEYHGEYNSILECVDDCWSLSETFPNEFRKNYSTMELDFCDEVYTFDETDEDGNRYVDYFVRCNGSVFSFQYYKYAGYFDENEMRDLLGRIDFESYRQTGS